MPSKSIFRQPGAQHFQVVHRSQRDPLINDPEASQHVLKAFVRSNEKKGKSRAELEAILPPTAIARTRENLGEASLYGVYYDDTEYDYMQHLRPVGIQEDGVDSMWLEAPSTSQQQKRRGKGKEFSLKDTLPEEALPSKHEISMDSVLASHEAIPTSIAGLQPDMDPHLRQTLEALEDDEFLDEDLQGGEDGDDFFDEIMAEGERDEDEPLDFEFREWGLDDEEEVEEVELDKADWQAQFSKFKKDQKANIRAAGSDDDDDGRSEGLDTLGTLPKLAVIGGKRRKTGTSDASGYSLSSSAVYRNEGLTTLDARFDQLMAKEYDEEDEDGELPPESESDSDEAPPLMERDDVEELVDDFLSNYEVVGGRKLRKSMPGETGVEKLESLRDALGTDGLHASIQRQAKTKEREIPMPVDIDDKYDRWDCETILSTYSNLENHPKLLRVRDINPDPRNPKIHLDKKTDMPITSETKMLQLLQLDDHDDEDGTDSDATTRPSRTTTTRPQNETKEEKKSRKNAVKEQKQVRRKEKKSTKELFAAERKHQLKIIAKEPLPMKKL